MRWLGISLIALGAAWAGFYLSQLYFDEPLPASRLSPGGVVVGSQRPDFRLGSSTGEIVTAEDFDGQVLLLNFWATWCEPCRREMPLLMRLQEQYGARGLQVVGVALDDVKKARDFVREYDIGYPILVGAGDVMETSLAFGNVDGVLPYSVLVDRSGVIRWQYIGEFPSTDITTLLEEYL
jgi:peroxiredoxin